MSAKPAFEVDKRGLEKILARRGKSFAILELIQNAFDENVTEVSITLKPVAKSRMYHEIIVTDDSPEGFADLSHAYTLFAESNKKSNPNQRGRFNLGEKLVLACCRKASISTTSGTITWKGDTRVHGRNKTDVGSIFRGEIKMNRAEAEEAIYAVRTILVPKNINLYVNGEPAPNREPSFQFKAILPTEISNEDGYLTRTRRKTDVRLYKTPMNETSTIYELGIPVVEIDGPYHVDVQQKIPLNSDRDNVTPSYRRELHVLILKETYSTLDDEEARYPWIDEALESLDLPPEAVDAVISARYGAKRVIRDPSDPESNKLAVSKGYVVIEPRSFNKHQWRTIKAAKAALPAGQITPSPRPYDQDGDTINTLNKDEWTPGMLRFYQWAVGIAQSTLGVRLTLQIAKEPSWGIQATWASPGQLVVNLSSVGHKFFNEPPGPTQLALLIHEMGHEYSGDHLSSKYHDALCTIGAKLAFIALDGPEIVRRNT